MGLSYEDRLALRVLRSRAQRRAYWRETRMNLFGELRPFERRALRLGVLADDLGRTPPNAKIQEHTKKTL